MTGERPVHDLLAAFEAKCDEIFPPHPEPLDRDFYRLDLADRRALLKGQRARIWRARIRECVRMFWREHDVELIAAAITGCALAVMALPPERALITFVWVLAIGGAYGFVWLCTEIRREWRAQRERDGRQ